jgi:phosphonate transport system ATP-binding protein
MILQFADASKSFDGGAAAVDNVSFDVPTGQFCVVLGASGAGKSTLLRMVNGLIQPTSGTVHFHGTQVEPKTWKEIRPRVAMVHQQFNLVPRLSVHKNVLSGTLPRVSTLAALFGIFPRKYQKRACSLLAEVGLSEKHLYRRAMQLSGGEQQRVAIARAFILEPELVLADEPVASLDPQTSRAILELLRKASRQHGATVLCSLHQIELAIEFADRIVGMSQGKIVFDGPPDKFDQKTQDSVYGKSEHGEVADDE